MSNELKFKGTISLHRTAYKKKVLFRYETISSEHYFHQSMMNSFKNVCFTFEEKKKLSKAHRIDLFNYLNINLFELNKYANDLTSKINEIANSESELLIEASDYGAYICLAALFSGKISKKIKVSFKLVESPLGLFPDTLLKKNPTKNQTIFYNLNSDSWFNEFQTLCENKYINYKFSKVA
jgi:hypothetical protein